MDGLVARLYARGVNVPWVVKAKGVTTMNSFLRRIGKHLGDIDADAYHAMLGQRLNELDTITTGLDMLRSIDCPILCPFICAVVLASAHGEWGFPEMRPPFVDYREKMVESSHLLVDVAQFMSLTSKNSLTRIEVEREHVATTKRVLGEALFIEQATLGPQQMSIGKGEGDSQDVDFALVYDSTDVDKVKNVGSMSIPWREQVWKVIPVLEQHDTLMLFPPSIESIREHVSNLFEGSTVTYLSGALLRVVGTNLPSHKVLASPTRFFLAGSDEHVVSQENFSVMPYKTAERRVLVDGSNVVLIQLNPWSKEPNEFASRVFELPPDADSCDEINEPIVGDVVAVPECALAPVVKEHLGLKQAKPPLNIRFRIFDHALLLAREANMLEPVARQVKMNINYYGSPDPTEIEGLQLLPKVMFSSAYD